MDKATQDQLTRGARMTELLKQGRYLPMPAEEQSLAIFAGNKGFLDDLPVADVVRFRIELLEYIRTVKPEVLEMLVKEQKYTAEIETAATEAIAAFKAQFAVSE